MSEHKPWQPRVRQEPVFNPFEPSTDWTRDIGANERIEIPDEEEVEDAGSPAQKITTKDDKLPAK